MYQTVKREQLKQMLDARAPFFLINVLGRDAFRQGHIPGSFNVPEADEGFTDEVKALVGSKEAKIVVYCASEDCTASPKAAHALDEAGFRRVFDFAGGLRDWKEAGYPLDAHQRHGLA